MLQRVFPSAQSGVRLSANRFKTCRDSDASVVVVSTDRIRWEGRNLSEDPLADNEKNVSTEWQGR